MKTHTGLSVPRSVLVLLTLAVVNLAVPAYAADKLFSGTTSWVSGPWSPTGIPGTTDNAQFGSAGSANVGINMDSIVPAGGCTIGSLEILNTRNNLNLTIGNSVTTRDGDWTFNGNTLNSVANTVIRNNGAGTTTLTLQDIYLNGTKKMPLIFNTPASAVIDATANIVISSVIKKADYGFTKIGAGTLTLSGDNTYTGPTIISGGRLLVQHNNALGTAGNVTINAGSGNQLYLAANGLNVGRDLVINGGGSTGAGALHYNQATGSATYSGNIAINGLPDAGGHFGTSGGQLILTGLINSPASEVRVRIGKVRFSNSGSSYSALAIQGNATLQLGVNNAIPIGASVNMATVNSGNSVLDLNGFNQELAGLTKDAVATSTTAIVDNTAAATAPELKLNIASANTFNGVIQNTAGTLALTKTGAGGLTLSGVNTYSGNTKVTQGTLALTGSGSIANSPQIELQSGAFLDVSGLSSTFTLGGSQTLKGNGSLIGNVVANGNVSPGASIGTLSLNGDLTLAGTTTMELDRGAAGQTADLLAANNVYLGGTLTIQNIGASLQAGDSFDLFNGTIHDNGFAWVPAFALDGGLSWDLSQLSASGIISVAAVPEPGFSALLLGGLALLLARGLRRSLGLQP